MGESFGNAALRSWNVNALFVELLCVLAFIYIRGWFRARAHGDRLAAFFGGMLLLFLALDSPLDAFSRFFLWVHMTQHILLLLAAPLLIVYARPHALLLRGLPQTWARDGFGPFLKSPMLHQITRQLTSPVVTWIIFAATLLFWHLPRLYELALNSPGWHGVQHACFFWAGILFWWPLLNPRPSAPQWLGIPYLMLTHILNTAFSAFLIFSGRLLYPIYSTARLTQMSALDDQALAGLVMWVPASMFFLIPALVLAARLMISPANRLPVDRSERRAFHMNPVQIRRFGRPVMLLAAIGLVLSGLAGRQFAAGLPWFQWRALSIAALLLFGNLFCMTCPLTFLRDLARKFVTPRMKWPDWLRTKWLAIGLFLLWLWAYQAFSLWNQPRLTAAIIIGYVISILLVDCTWRGASFCKYVCPIGQFNFVVSTLSPTEVRVRGYSTCGSCRTHDCIRGNEHARGCELLLFQPVKTGNQDCTFCMDCVKACPSSNVALLPSEPSHRVSSGMAPLTAVVVFGAFVNAAGMLKMLGWYSRPWPFALLVTAATLIPAVLFAKSAITALLPLGISMWTAHLFIHVAPAGMSTVSVRETGILILDCGLLATLFRLFKLPGPPAVPWAILSAVLYAIGCSILFLPMQMIGMRM